MTNITTLSNLAVVSYLEDDITNIPLTQSVGTYLPTTPTPTINAETGFRAQAHYSVVDHTLVITYTGTDDDEDSTSNRFISGLSAAAQAEQAPQALAFAQAQITAAQALYGNNIDIVFNGHSLGGYLATVTRHALNVGTATVFNAPGVGAGPTAGFQDEQVTYVYSNPNDWQEVLDVVFGVDVDASDIHNVGDRVSANLIFFMQAGGHAIENLATAANNGDQPVTLTEFMQEWIRQADVAATRGNTEAAHVNLAFIDVLNQYDIDIPNAEAQITEAIFGDNCFPSGTPITLADGSTKPIEDITTTDQILTHTANGTPVAGDCGQAVYTPPTRSSA